MTFSFPGTKVPRHFASREQMFQGTNFLQNESSTYGTFAHGSKSTWERKFQLPSWDYDMIRFSPENREGSCQFNVARKLKQLKLF